MGVAMGLVIAAAVMHPDKPIIHVSGGLGDWLLRHGDGDAMPLVLRSSQMIQFIRLRAAQGAISSRSEVNHLFASGH